MAIIDDPLSATDAAAARTLLREAPYAYVASVEEQGPYVVPMNFAWTEEAAGGKAPSPTLRSEAEAGGPSDAALLTGTIYFHTGAGRKTDAWAADPRVCVAVSGGVGFIQGESPCRDAFAYRSLLVWGRVRPVEGDAARETALRTIVAKYDPAAAGMPFGERDFAQTIIYALDIEAASYKQEP